MANRKKKPPLTPAEVIQEGVITPNELRNLHQVGTTGLIPVPTTEVQTESCSNCRFWREIADHPHMGQCKAEPIAILHGSSLTGLYPTGKFLVMPAHEWCGRHSTKRSNNENG